MAIKAIKGLGKAFLKRAKDKAKDKAKKLNTRDTARFQGVYRKHKKAREAVNKPAVEEYNKKVKEIRSRITKGESKEDMRELQSAADRLNSKILKKDRVKMYDDMPDIRQRFRGAPGPQRKLVKGEKNWMRRAGILQADRLKRLGPSEKIKVKKK